MLAHQRDRPFGIARQRGIHDRCRAFRDVPAGAAFRERFAKNPGLRESLCKLRPILSQMARARSTINLETEWGFIAPWAVRGGPAGDGESLFVCERARVLVGGVGLLHADAPIAIANANATIAIDPRGRITSPSRCR